MKLRCHFPLVIYCGVKDIIFILSLSNVIPHSRIQPWYIGSPSSFRLPEPSKWKAHNCIPLPILTYFVLKSCSIWKVLKNLSISCFLWILQGQESNNIAFFKKDKSNSFLSLEPFSHAVSTSFIPSEGLICMHRPGHLPPSSLQGCTEKCWWLPCLLNKLPLKCTER